MYRHEGNGALSSDHVVCVTADNEWCAAIWHRKRRWIVWLIMQTLARWELRDKLYTCTILWYSFYCLSLSEHVTETNTSIQISHKHPSFSSFLLYLLYWVTPSCQFGRSHLSRVNQGSHRLSFTSILPSEYYIHHEVRSTFRMFPHTTCPSKVTQNEALA